MMPQAIVVASIGDATISALIAGVFLTANTFLTYAITRRQDRSRTSSKQEVRQDSRRARRHNRSTGDTGTDSDTGASTHRDRPKSP